MDFFRAVYKVWWKIDNQNFREEELKAGVTYASLTPDKLFHNGRSIINTHVRILLVFCYKVNIFLR